MSITKVIIAMEGESFQKEFEGVVYDFISVPASVIGERNDAYHYQVHTKKIYNNEYKFVNPSSYYVFANELGYDESLGKEAIKELTKRDKEETLNHQKIASILLYE